MIAPSIEQLTKDMQQAETLETYLHGLGRRALLLRFTPIEVSDAAWCSSIIEDRQRRRLYRRLEHDHTERTSEAPLCVPESFDDLLERLESEESLRGYLHVLGCLVLLERFTPREIAVAAYRAGVAGERHRRRLVRQLALHRGSVAPPPLELFL